MIPLMLERPLPQMPSALPCPFCGEDVALEPGVLADGSEVACLHCGEQVTLTREYVEEADARHWSLVDPDAGLDDEA